MLLSFLFDVDARVIGEQFLPHSLLREPFMEVELLYLICTSKNIFIYFCDWKAFMVQAVLHKSLHPMFAPSRFA
jgi:hypothetical protein